MTVLLLIAACVDASEPASPRETPPRTSPTEAELESPTPATATAPSGDTQTLDTSTHGAGTTADTGAEPLPNLLVNGGFERGQSWFRPAGYTNHAWATTGDLVHGSTATFAALEGAHAQKLWGFYRGEVPNDSEHGLRLVDLGEGDTHTVQARLYQHRDDPLTGGAHVALFLRYLDAEGSVIEEVESVPLTPVDVPGVWHTRSVSSDVPVGAVHGELGLRVHLADWSDTGSVYVDDVSWTSTGTGAVDGERLLVWNDEFSGPALDETKWTRLVLPAFRYNNELQAYTSSPDNASVRDGQLVITAREEPDGSITSARLVTDGKGDWTYGRIEAMARVPSTVGTWPAFWMLPSDWSYGGWPDSGEIDIMEHVGCDIGHVHQTVHTGAYNHLLGTQQGGSAFRDATEAMHLYAVDWTRERLAFTIDGESVFTFDNDGGGQPATWPFDQRFHIILNLAFGGDWGGWCGVDRAGLPTEYSVDWVRVYQ